jgi:hypothetical protein
LELFRSCDRYSPFILLQQAPTSIPADPKGLQLLVEYLNEAYGNLPVYIQETGMSISLL